MKKQLIILIFTLLSVLVFPMKKSQAQIIEIGATAGMSYYIGDINPKSHFNQSKLGLGALVRYYQNMRWAFRFQYSNLNLTSSDAVVGFRPERGLSFTNNINDFALLAEFNFFDYWTGSNRNYITPYIFAGVSVFTFNPCAEDGTELRPLSTEGTEYGNVAFSVPFGIGLKYSVFKRVGMILEWRIHKTFTDYIDDVSGNYPEYNNQDASAYNSVYIDPSGQMKPGMQRGNGETGGIGYNCDWFSMLSLSVVYKFNLPKKENCHSGRVNFYY